ncbi:SH3 and PX domain-containing protein 2A-like isoform X1 [Crassostrea angulata]|uniref:SH3 and PX domain-containing protein 2A-like isoform X1 n=1 Tax=Magallana angulata TaxID=2784310 RepID=UPI0022B1ED6E|nr:SH3 and PX domain-containing protein 2A-like isoform X1 [Crassostrea angulata]
MGTRGGELKIINVDVYDVQKRRKPSKHYVYIIKVTWSNKKVKVIYRRYSRFFDFQHSLLEKFPVESGQLDPNQRVIPFLPGKIYFGRSQVRDVAVKRLSHIDDYCKALINLDERISQCEEVRDFFSVEEDDINPPSDNERKKKATFDTASKISEPRLGEQYRAIADYTKEDKWDLNLKAGTEVEVIEKTESGWWFVHVQDQQGWVPSTYLKRADGGKEELGERARPGEEEQYICTEDYFPSNPDEVSLDRGTVVEVIQKNLDGWWWVRQNGKEGWAPATYMMKAEKAHMERVARASGVQIVGKLEDISDLMQDEDGDDSWDDEPDPPPRPIRNYLSQKSRSLERGGSLRPPPRQNSIKNIKVDIKPPKVTKSQYVTIADFTDTVGDGISFSRGESVEVKEKTADGWWFVSIGGKEGWAPSTFIESKEMDAIPEDNHVSNVSNDAYSEVAIESSDDEDYEHPEATPAHTNAYEEVDYEVPVKSPGEGEKPRFSISELQNKLKPGFVNDRPSSAPPKQVDRRLMKNQNAAIKRPTSKPPPPPVAMATSNDSKTGPPPIDRSSLAAALKTRNGSKPSEEVSKPGLEAQSSNSSSDSDKKPILPPKLAVVPSSAGRKSPSPLTKQVPRERIHSDGGNNLAELLKAKFESRKTMVDESGNTEDANFNTYPKKSGVQISQLPISQTKSNPEFTDKSLTGKPAVLPKGDRLRNHLKPPNKNEGAQKRFSMQEESSELTNALQARLRRQSNVEVTTSQHYSAVEKPKKSFPTKPLIPEKTVSEDKKPMVPPKIMVKKTEGKENSVAAVPKSRFEPGSKGGWKKESTKPKSKPPVLAKPKKPTLPKEETKTVVPGENNNEPPVKSGFAKELASKLSSNIGGKQDTNAEVKPPIPKKSPIVQKVYSSKVENNVKEVTSMKSSVQAYKSMAKYEAEGNGEISFEEGVILEVLDKTDGWWLVRVGTSEGWAPVTYIAPCGVGDRPPSPVCDSGFTSPEEGSNSVTSVKYRTCAEFVPESETELGFKEGLVVEVLDASEDDWWYARVDGKEGWVPAEYLEEV